MNRESVSKAAKWATLVVLVVALAILAFALGIIVERDGGGESSPSEVEDNGGRPDFDALYEIYDLLQQYYVEPDLLDDQSLYEAAVNGILRSLSDTGTYYVDPTTYNVSVMPSGTFEGIGATVADKNGQIVIVAPIKDTPADRAGIRSGDAVIAVNGESTEGWTVEKAVQKIRGPKGTEVTLTIEHEDGETEEITLTRDEIEVESVSTVPPGGEFKDAAGAEVTDLAYVQILEFTAVTQAQLEPVLEQVAAGGYEGLVLDLRSNPGGLLETVVGVADMFLEEGTILVEVKRGGDEKEYTANSGGEATEIPIAVLLNRFSASGSEVLAAALQDNNRAVVIGEKSFGKGTVNTAQELSDGRGAIFVTVARWLTPDRILIDGVGVRPDIEVELTDEDIDLRRDAQLLRAIDYLRGEQ